MKVSSAHTADLQKGQQAIILGHALFRAESGLWCCTGCLVLSLSLSIRRVSCVALLFGLLVVLELHPTCTTGIIASSVRLNGALALIQTDGAVHKGNSGGPLLNKYVSTTTLAHHSQYPHNCSLSLSDTLFVL
jgi:hypothetical protein